MLKNLINRSIKNKRLRNNYAPVIAGIFFVAILIVSTVSAQKPRVVKPVPPVAEGKDGKLVYTSDSLGNRIPDFSYCGYMASEKVIPNVPVKIVVPVKAGDATLRIQSAINYVASLPADQTGLRGAVLLEKGTYQISGFLNFNVSGVVLRGSGMAENGTILLGSGLNRETLLQIAGKNDRKPQAEVKITDRYVPVNSNQINVADANAFKAGDEVLIRRPSTLEWIKTLGTDIFGGGISSLGWKPGQREIFWERKVLAVKGSTLTLDVPLTTALDANFGGGTISKYNFPGRIQQVGIENLRCVSTFDKNNLKDEAHRWMAITMENVQDSWIRQVNFEHFAGSAVDLLETAKRITVEDCKSLSPVSEIGGQRRYAFQTSGQQTLFQRLFSEYGYHDFAVGYCAPGPNAFVQCQSAWSYSYSGSIDSWASGVLFDIVNVDGNALSYKNLGQDAQGAGWNAANSLFWNCTAARVDCYQPPTAQNWAFGTWAQFSGDGYWGDSNNTINPRSFYYAQLRDRAGKEVLKEAQILPLETNASSSPTVEQAAKLVAASHQLALTMDVWIDQAFARNPISTNNQGVKTIDQIGYHQAAPLKSAEEMQVKNGWLVRGNVILTGKRSSSPWWMGTVKPDFLKQAKPAITRFVPGRTGTGLTDNLDDFTNAMLASNTIEMEQNYALWYERRRDDHERIRRMDGEVWPPFYELPFARSGKETAWDGLSKYDLTKYNPFYWNRLKQFADLADQKGLVLINQNYFQHNIIEAGAHYADFPWRPVNNINNTGFPEPPPYAGDKRIFMADQFYDETNATRRKIHQTFILQNLNNFADNNGVIQFIGEEFTGPLHFVQFWIDTILGWEKETGKKETIGLCTTKDVQDGILTDAKRAAAVNVIDIRYWYYQADGTAYAPLGGQNLAPRQHARLLKPKKTSFEQVYRAVREYRGKYPGKAVMYSADSYDSLGWAVFMAGGSLAQLPPATSKEFLAAAGMMQPVDLSGKPAGEFTLANGNKGFIVYNQTQKPMEINLSAGNYLARWIDPKTGSFIGEEEKIKGGKAVELKTPLAGEAIVWLKSI